MYRINAVRIIPVTLASLVLATACTQKPEADEVAVEEDIIVQDGSVVSEWIVDEVEPIPARDTTELAASRPSNEHVWVPGEWNRDGDKWHWHKGKWAKPPSRDAAWMAGYWRMESDKWHWMPGHWTVTNRPYYFDQPPIPPAPVSEVKPEKPSGHDHWTAGNWDWDGHWYWVPGYWTSAPSAEAEWIAGHWDKYGVDGGYRWIDGHWRLVN